MDLSELESSKYATVTEVLSLKKEIGVLHSYVDSLRSELSFLRTELSSLRTDLSRPEVSISHEVTDLNITLLHTLYGDFYFPLNIPVTRFYPSEYLYYDSYTGYTLNGKPVKVLGQVYPCSGSYRRVTREYL
jgi:hypothetical protein